MRQVWHGAGPRCYFQKGHGPGTGWCAHYKTVLTVLHVTVLTLLYYDCAPLQDYSTVLTVLYVTVLTVLYKNALQVSSALPGKDAVGRRGGAPLVQGYLAHKKPLPPKDQHRSLGMVLL